MALLTTLTLSANGTVNFKAKNKRTGQNNRYTYIATGTFGSGTIAVNVSPDGSTYAPYAGATFTSAASGNIELNSDEINPSYGAFILTGATSPSITIRIYDNA